MSGGTFNSSGYVYYEVDRFADELENLIERNEVDDDQGYSPGYGEEVIKILREKLPEIRRIAATMKHIDYLYSGDHGEESFIEKMKRTEGNK